MSLPADQRLVTLLADRVELHVYALFHPPGRSTFRFSSAVIHPSGGGEYRKMFARVLNDIRADHRRAAFDVVHANRLYPGGLIAIVAGRLLRIPSIASIGGVELVNFPDIGYGGSQTKVARLLHGFVLGNADVVTVPSEYILRQALTVRPNRAYMLAPLPVDIDVYVSERTVDPIAVDAERPRIFSAGSLYPLKDQETLIRAFSIVHREFPRAVLTIAGGDPFGYRQLLEDVISELCLEGSVVFAGEVPHDNIGDYYRDADLFMYASRHESQGMVLLEAASQGLPIVSTDIGIASEMAPEAATVVPVRDPEALGLATLRILRDPALRRRLGSKAMQYIQDSFQDTTIVNRFIQIYQEAGR